MGRGNDGLHQRSQPRSLSEYLKIMTMNEKHNCTECARINDHEAVKGVQYPKKGFQ
jgi:hypothetical protein